MPYRSDHTVLLNDIEQHLAYIVKLLEKLLALAEKVQKEDGGNNE